MGGDMRKSDEEVVSEHDDAAFMARPHLWPYSALPVKKIVDGKRSHGLMEAGTTFVYEGATLAGISEPEIVKREYESYAAVVADGWVVD